METKQPIRIGAAYIRVSTDDQLEYSPESQIDEINAFAKRNNILLSKEYIFKEYEGVSGKKAEKRPAFQCMIAAAKKKPKPFDVILVWKFSRFARNQDESTFYKSILRKKLEIDVISVSEPILDGMYGRLIEMIIEWQDEFYLHNLSQEVKRGMKKKAEMGLYNGQMPLGYAKERGTYKIPQIIESESFIVNFIFSMFESGHDKNQIVRELNRKGYKTKQGRIFNAECVSYILDNPFYIGKVRWNRRNGSSSSILKDESEWIVSDAKHTPIISTETWEACQKRLKFIKASREKYAHPISHTKHWLSGMVKCPICGKSLSWKSGKCTTFQCLGYRTGIHNESQSVSEKRLIAAVIESMENVLNTSVEVKFEVVKTTGTSDSELVVLKKELSGIKQKESRIKDAYVNGIDSLEEYKENKEIITTRRAQLTDLIESFYHVEDPTIYNKQFYQSIKNVLGIIKSDAPFEEKAISFRSIVKKVIFFKETQTLEFHYYINV